MMERAPVRIRAILLMMAQVKYLIGDRLVAIGPVAPDLSASLASVAVAQAAYGHARFFYHWYSGESRSADDHLKQAGDWPEARELLGFSRWKTWVHLITVMWLVDTALMALLDTLGARDPEMARSVEKVSRETADTLLFTEDWVSLFLNDHPGVRQVVRDVAEALRPRLESLIGAVDERAAAQAHHRWSARLAGVA